MIGFPFAADSNEGNQITVTVDEGSIYSTWVATSSSVFGNDLLSHGPQLAIDGWQAFEFEGSFATSRQQGEWLQVNYISLHSGNLLVKTSCLRPIVFRLISVLHFK